MYVLLSESGTTRDVGDERASAELCADYYADEWNDSVSLFRVEQGHDVETVSWEQRPIYVTHPTADFILDTVAA